MHHIQPWSFLLNIWLLVDHGQSSNVSTASNVRWFGKHESLLHFMILVGYLGPLEWFAIISHTTRHRKHISYIQYIAQPYQQIRMVWTFITKWEENKQTHHNTFAFIPRAFGDLFDVIWVLVSRNSVQKYPKSSFPSGESQNPAQPLSNPKKLLIMPTVNKKTSLWLDDLDRHESTWIFSELQRLPPPPPPKKKKKR